MDNWKKDIFERLKTNSEQFLGYPSAKDFDYESFAPFLNLVINNVGDPEVTSTTWHNTKEIENQVVDFFIEILNSTRKNIWGYVTNGGTEGNLYGLYVAREAFPNAVVYYSETTHYSVKKNIHLLQIPNIVIRSQQNGEMDYEDLDNAISRKREYPAIFFLNIGTTMKEAVDQIDEVKKIIKKYAIKDYYIHCDAAFLGSFAPFIEDGPKFDFSEGADSIAISGHKFLGSPIPCGLILVKRKHRNRVAHSIAYVDTLDTTITGSRNGLTPLFIWDFIQKQGIEGLVERTKNCLLLAKYTVEKMNENGISAWRNKNALTVIFPMPSLEIREKYKLASEDNISHVICVPGISTEQIDALIQDLVEDQENAKTKIAKTNNIPKISVN